MDWTTTGTSLLVRQFAVYPQLSQGKMKCVPRGHGLAYLFNYCAGMYFRQLCVSYNIVVLYSIEEKSVTKLQLSELSKSQLPPLDAQSHCNIAFLCPRGHTNTGHR